MSSVADPLHSTPSPSVADRVKGMASHTLESVKEAGASVKHGAEEKACEVRHAAERYLEQGREYAVEAGHQVERYVRKEPVKALAVAAGIGLLIGFLVLPKD